MNLSRTESSDSSEIAVRIVADDHKLCMKPSTIAAEQIIK
jgi:hypothetical protein